MKVETSNRRGSMVVCGELLDAVPVEMKLLLCCVVVTMRVASLLPTVRGMR